MDVIAPFECRGKAFVARFMGEETQFELGIIQRDQRPWGTRLERVSDRYRPPRFLRYVLEIGLFRSEPSCCRPRLEKCGMDSPVLPLRRDERFNESRLYLKLLPVLEDKWNNRMRVAQ